MKAKRRALDPTVRRLHRQNMMIAASGEVRALELVLAKLVERTQGMLAATRCLGCC